MTKDVYAGSIWTNWYSSKVAIKRDYPTVSAASFMEQGTNKYPDGIALHYQDFSITNKELDRYANKFANFLHKMGLKKGDVVGINALNSPPFYIAFLGIQKAGCVYTGVSPLQTADELEFQLNDCGAKALLTMDLFWGNVKQIVNKSNVKCLIIASLSDFLPNASEIPDSVLAEVSTIGVFRFTDIMRDMTDEAVKENMDPDDLSIIMYTGGTTGRPKGATWTNSEVINFVVRYSTWIDTWPGKDVLLTPFPMFIGAGMLVNILSYSNAVTQVVISNPRDIDYLIAALRKYNPNILIAVPTLWLQLMKRPEFRSWDFSAVRKCGSGAAPFPAEYLDDFQNLVGKGKLIETYGLSETGFLVSTPPLKYKVGSIGVPIIDIEVKIVDPVTRKPMPIGEIGEIAAKGSPGFFTKGYYRKSDETAKVLKEGWFYTGDLGFMDEDGFIFIVDRIKDMINVSGYKVFSLELDDVIMMHPDVYLAASVGIPDPERPGSERVATAIMLQPGIDMSTEEKNKLLVYLKEKVAPYKVPKVIEFMEQFPISPVGKILKRELREILSKKYIS